jgi:DNA polymerase-3 subunit beta
MKISSLQENLKNGLMVVSRIVGRKVNLPILNNVKIKAHEGKIQLISTDLQIGVVCDIRGKVEKEGEYTIDSKVITEYISLLPNNKVNIEEKEGKIEIKSDNYKTVVKGMSAEEYPLIPVIDRKNKYVIKISDLKIALSQVIFAVSTSETRIELSGVYFNFKKDGLVIAATDSYRLAEKEINIINKDEIEESVIIPSKTLQELLRIISMVNEGEIDSESGNVEIFVSENQILFSLKGIDLISRLIEGQYPDYKQIIPENSKTSSIVNKNEFTRAVKAASIFSKIGVNDINLDFPIDKNKIIISSASSQTGENITEIDSKVTGEDNGIVVNFKYLLEGINNIGGDNLKIEVTDGNTPCILKSEKDDSFIYIVMPIKQ